MVLILWEEFLFPIQIKPAENGVIFRNHRTKLKTQLLIYSPPPPLPDTHHFCICLSQLRGARHTLYHLGNVCCILPVVLKLLSGINNYNDFLKLTLDSIEYKNNKRNGCFRA